MSRIRRVKPPKVVTVIGQGTLIEGHVRFGGGLHVDGKIKGNVTGEPDSNATLILSEQGIVEGDVRVDHLVIDGRIIGDVHAGERAELAPHARITGTLYYQLIEMAMGAEVNGKLVHRDSEEPQRLAYDRHGESLPDLSDDTGGAADDETAARDLSGEDADNPNEPEPRRRRPVGSRGTKGNGSVPGVGSEDSRAI